MVQNPGTPMVSNTGRMVRVKTNPKIHHELDITGTAQESKDPGISSMANIQAKGPSPTWNDSRNTAEATMAVYLTWNNVMSGSIWAKKARNVMETAIKAVEIRRRSFRPSRSMRNKGMHGASTLMIRSKFRRSSSNLGTLK